MKRQATAAALLAAALLSFSSLAAPAQTRRSTLRLGVISDDPNDPQAAQRWVGELVARMRQRLAPAGIDVGAAVVAPDVDELGRRLARGEADLVIETVFSTLALQQRSGGLSPALVMVRRGQREYHSVFFCRKDSPIHTLDDLRGRTLVLQSLRSTSAFALPKAEVERAGLTIGPAEAGGADVHYAFAQTEANEAVWVVERRADAGAFNDGDWAALPDGIRSQLRVFHETRPLVRGLLSFRTGLDARVRAEAEGVLVGLASDEAGRAALAAAGITRFEPLTLADRQELRGIAATLLRAGSRR